MTTVEYADAILEMINNTDAEDNDGWIGKEDIAKDLDPDLKATRVEKETFEDDSTIDMITPLLPDTAYEYGSGFSKAVRYCKEKKWVEEQSEVWGDTVRITAAGIDHLHDLHKG
ncbi:hypothetical protein BerOc1_02983 [Pseudodesulfovibrio hydrargyri]|uniref:Uncharacterized protein n=1 Tax=Pseudodesulfovibrio hydrargyri TaxID=2125990 RepID=A0A1J5MWY6_9BACT|nr:hypothetical protein [Pseudodesulfovibrio hydrargyri]OIQ51038.1 hypothetical protein BerOc1_02983 [Pseudodesulfovibrio hydrargyri]